MKEGTPDDSNESIVGDHRTSADVLAFKLRLEVGGYDSRNIKPLEGLENVRRRSDVTWLGESAVPIAVLNELSEILDSHPELRAMKILDHEGQEMTLWTGDLPNGYG